MARGCLGVKRRRTFPVGSATGARGCGPGRRGAWDLARALGGPGWWHDLGLPSRLGRPLLGKHLGLVRSLRWTGRLYGGAVVGAVGRLMGHDAPGTRELHGGSERGNRCGIGGHRGVCDRLVVFLPATPVGPLSEACDPRSRGGVGGREGGTPLLNDLNPRSTPVCGGAGGVVKGVKIWPAPLDLPVEPPCGGGVRWVPKARAPYIYVQEGG